MKNTKSWVLLQDPKQENHQILLKKLLSAASYVPELGKVFQCHNVDQYSDVSKLFDKDCNTEVQGCPLNVPESKRNKVKLTQQKNLIRVKPDKRFPKLAQEMHRGKVNDSTLLDVAERHLAGRPLVMCQNLDGSAMFFRGCVRGDKTYSLRMGDRIHAAGTALEAIEGTALFVTITYAVNQESPDLFDAQKIHNEVVNKFLRKARKLGELYYICVLEQTAKGYPHVHIIMKWKGKFFKDKEGPAGRKLLKSKKLFRMMKSWQPYPQFKCLVIKGEATAAYVTKYVSKGINPPSKTMGGLNEQERKERRKSLLCYIIGYMARARQFRISKNLKKGEETKPQEVLIVDTELLDAVNQTGILPPEAGPVLISFLNKLTEGCKAHVWAMFKDSANTPFEKAMGFHESPDKRLLKDFKRNSYPLGCPGCKLVEILQSLSDKVDLVEANSLSSDSINTGKWFAHIA
jgi:hypothetical protein